MRIIEEYVFAMNLRKRGSSEWMYRRVLNAIAISYAYVYLYGGIKKKMKILCVHIQQRFEENEWKCGW